MLCISPFISSSALECTTGKVHANHERLKLNAIRRFLDYADYVNLLGKSKHSIKKDRSVKKSIHIHI